MITVTTPTTAEIRTQIVDHIATSIGQSIPLMPKSFIRVLAAALAGVFVLLYKYAGWQTLQMFVRTASFSETEIGGKTIRPLVEWGLLSGAGPPGEATAAQLRIEVEVEQQGDTLPTGSQLLRSQTGVTYITTAPVALDAATVEVDIRAVADQEDGGGLGAIGNLDPGDTVDFASPLTGVARTATVTAQIETAADGESESAYRTRVIERFQRRPQGGAYVDYAEWGGDVAGIARVYPYTGQPGRVNVYVRAADEPDGIPTSAQLDAVEAAINFDDNGLASRRPIGALVSALPITRRPFDVEIEGLDVPDQPTVETQIETALDEYLRDREPYIVGLSIPPREDRITASALTGVVDEIVNEAGGVFTGLTLLDGGSPVTSYILDEGELAKLDGVTFV